MLYKNKKLALLAGALGLSLALTACGGKDEQGSAATSSPTAPAQSAAASPEASPTPTERIMKDVMGNEVKIPANPERIIASYLEDHLVALGVKPVAQWSVANGTQEYLQDELAGIPTIPYDLPFEAVASFNPDLIIAGGTSVTAGDKYEQYSKIAPTFTLGDEINGDWRQALLKIGEVLDIKEKAQEALDDYDKKAKEAKEKVQNAVGTKSAAAIWLLQKQFYIVSETLSSGAVLYNDLGFAVPDAVKEISASSSANWNSISMESMATMDVDYIFLINGDQDSGAEALKDPVWSGIPAVKNGNVFEVNENDGSWLYSGAIANSKIIDEILENVVK